MNDIALNGTTVEDFLQNRPDGTRRASNTTSISNKGSIVSSDVRNTHSSSVLSGTFAGKKQQQQQQQQPVTGDDCNVHADSVHRRLLREGPCPQQQKQQSHTASTQQLQQQQQQQPQDQQQATLLQRLRQQQQLVTVMQEQLQKVTVQNAVSLYGRPAVNPGVCKCVCACVFGARCVHVYTGAYLCAEVRRCRLLYAH